MNLKIVVALLAGSLALTGCKYDADWRPSEMQKAKQGFACKDRGGVYEYVSPLYKASCRDGSTVDGWSQIILTPEYYPEAGHKSQGGSK